MHKDRYSNHDIHFISEACIPGRQRGPEAAFSLIEQGTIRSDLPPLQRRPPGATHVKGWFDLQAVRVAARAELELKPLPFAHVSTHRCYLLLDHWLSVAAPSAVAHP